MIEYRAGYKHVGGGVHAQVIDFPAALTCGRDLPHARRLLAAALVDAAEAAVAAGLALPTPDPDAVDADMDVVEPIYSQLRARFAAGAS